MIYYKMLSRLIEWFGCKSRRKTCDVCLDNHYNQQVPDFLTQDMLQSISVETFFSSTYDLMSDLEFTDIANPTLVSPLVSRESEVNSYINNLSNVVLN